MSLDEGAISEFILLNYVIGDHSFIKGRRTKLRIDVPKLEKYKNTTFSDVEDALKNSIEKVTENKDKVSVLLSGGKDARLLLALASSLNLDVTAITVGDKTNRYEEKAASDVTKKMGVAHKIVRIPDIISPDIISEIGEVTDGTSSFSIIAPIYLIREELSDFDIVLSGNLMTEIMDTCEYRWYDSKNPVEVMKRKHFHGGKLLKKEYLDIATENFSARYKNKSLEEIILDTEFRNRSRAIKALNKLLDVTVAIPAADKDVINATFSLPIEERMNGRLVMDILNKSYPDFAIVRSSKSVFPLYYPWWIHYGIQRMKDRYYFMRNNFKIWDGTPRGHKMGMWDQGFVYKYKIGDFVKKSLDNFDFYMIKKEVVRQVIQDHFAEKKDGSFCIPKLLTLKSWLDKNYK